MQHATGGMENVVTAMALCGFVPVSWPDLQRRDDAGLHVAHRRPSVRSTPADSHRQKIRRRRNQADSYSQPWEGALPQLQLRNGMVVQVGQCHHNRKCQAPTEESHPLRDSPAQLAAQLFGVWGYRVARYSSIAKLPSLRVATRPSATGASALSRKPAASAFPWFTPGGFRAHRASAG